MTFQLLADIWFFILIATFLLYVLLDGFDLGIGILTLFNKEKAFHDAGIEAIHGVWHANQTWLIVTGASLLGAFPLAYGVILSALYIPVILLLVGLIFRGIALEYYYLSDKGKEGRTVLYFGAGSLLAAISQGFGVGTLLMGLPVEGGHFAGGVWYWLSPLPLLIAAALPVVYSLLGSTRMIAWTTGREQGFARKAARMSAVLSLGAVLVLAVWGLAAGLGWTANWFAWPGILFTLLPLVVGVVFFAPLILDLDKGRSESPFRWAMAAVALLFTGVASGFYPYVILPGTSIAEAASNPATLTVMLVGFGVAGPVILLYTVFMYRVFARKESREKAEAA